MYSQSSSAMAPPQKPETFMLSDAEQQSLPQDAQVALQQVDNRECHPLRRSPIFHLEEPPAKPVLTEDVHSEIFPHICARRLDAGPVHSKVFAADGRIRVLCIVVSSACETGSPA